MSTPKPPITSIPILALIFNIIGGLVLLAAVALGVGAAMQFKSVSGGVLVVLPVVGGLIFTGVLYLGAAEAIQLIARIAIEACRTAEAAERSAAAADFQRNQRLYLYQFGNEIRGPVSLDVLRSLRAVKSEARQVTGETLVCRVGDADWKRLADWMEKPAAA